MLKISCHQKIIVHVFKVTLGPVHGHCIVGFTITVCLVFTVITRNWKKDAAIEASRNAYMPGHRLLFSKLESLEWQIDWDMLQGHVPTGPKFFLAPFKCDGSCKKNCRE